MIQVAYAIAAHEPVRERSLDIGRVKAHILVPGAERSEPFNRG